ncbi:MAG: Fe-S cluster assembly protein SufD [Flavobacteriales bacterium]
MNWTEHLNIQELDFPVSEQLERKNAFNRFSELGLPTRKNEAWKYTNLKKFIDENWRLSKTSKADSNELPKKINPDALQFVFINGRFSETHSDAFPSNFEIRNLSSLENYPKDFGKIATNNKESLLELNKALFQDGLFIHLKKSETLEQNIELLFVYQSDEKQLSLPRNFFILDENAEIFITERHINLSKTEQFTNALTEVHVAKHARFNMCKIQNEDEQFNLIDHCWVNQDEQSYAQVDTFSFGGKLIRNNLNFFHLGEHLESHLRAISIGDKRSHIDHSTLVDHAEANGFSNQLYKGIYNEQSHGVFNGRIMVRKDAQKTNAFQQNNNIVRSKQASIDTKPQLEIFADDVKCSHGCTVGQMDEQAVFYLQQRGIPKKEATAMLIYAFANEALENIKEPHLLQHIKTIMAHKLNVAGMELN